MIRLTIELEDMDFDDLIHRYLPVIGEQLRSSGNPLGALLSGGALRLGGKGVAARAEPGAAGAAGRGADQRQPRQADGVSGTAGR